MSALVITLRSSTASALDFEFTAPEPATAIRHVARQAVERGINPSVPVHVVRQGGWIIARLPSLKATADGSAFKPDVACKLAPSTKQADPNQPLSNRARKRMERAAIEASRLRAEKIAA